jgi:hypothetical protein
MRGTDRQTSERSVVGAGAVVCFACALAGIGCQRQGSGLAGFHRDRDGGRDLVGAVEARPPDAGESLDAGDGATSSDTAPTEEAPADAAGVDFPSGDDAGDDGGGLDGTIQPDGEDGDGGGGGPACTTTPSSCTCLLDIPGEPRACSTTSVRTDADEGTICCRRASSCRCGAFSCRQQVSPLLCQCGVSYLVESAVQGPRVASCSVPGRCCLSPARDRCACIPLPCPAGDIEVPSCTPATVAACAPGETSVAVCN